MFHPTIPIAIAVAAAALMLTVFLLVRLQRRSHLGGVQIRQGGVPPLRYAPVHRLLQEEDFRFLERQPGYRAEVGRVLRARRVAVFRRYLSHMEAEFRRLHLTLRLLVLTAGEDRPEVARLLVEQRVLFAFRLREAQLRLALFRLGVRPPDLSVVSDTLLQMREQVAALQSLARPSEQPL